jgi:hypothetical protein
MAWPFAEGAPRSVGPNNIGEAAHGVRRSQKQHPMRAWIAGAVIAAVLMGSAAAAERTYPRAPRRLMRQAAGSGMAPAEQQVAPDEKDSAVPEQIHQKFDRTPLALRRAHRPAGRPQSAGMTCTGDVTKRLKRQQFSGRDRSMSDADNKQQWLQRLIGKWTYTLRTATDSDQPGATAAGTEIVCAIGDLWVLEENKGIGPEGEASHTVTTISFDRGKGRITGAVIGTMTPHLFIYDGELSEDATSLVWRPTGQVFWRGTRRTGIGTSSVSSMTTDMISSPRSLSKTVNCASSCEPRPRAWDNAKQVRRPNVRCASP